MSQYDEQTDKQLLDSQLASIGEGHELPSDRLIDEARGTTVWRGQFGVKWLLLITAATAFACSVVPRVFGWDQESFWFLLLVGFVLISPTLAFILGAIADITGLDRKSKLLLCVGFLVCAPFPLVFTYLLAAISRPTDLGNDLIGMFFLTIMIWLPQLAALGFCYWVYNPRPRKTMSQSGESTNSTNATKP